MVKCSVLQCDIPSLANGLCRSHYMVAYIASNPLCTITGCTRKQLCKNMCRMHYHRARNGVPSNRKPRRLVPNYQTAHAKVKRQFGPAKWYECVKCGAKANDWAYDGTDPTQLLGTGSNGSKALMWYSLFPEFYMPLCKGCHQLADKLALQAELNEYRKSLAEKHGWTVVA